MNQVKDFFNKLAPQWDTLCVHNKEKIKTLLHLVAIKEEATILDIGCGTGILETFLLHYNPNAIVAVDLAEQMIEEAVKKYDDPRITFRCMDVMQIEKEQYDYIFIYSAFPHFKDVEGLLQKIEHLLLPGGKVIICHSESRDKINGHHEAKASDVSCGLPEAKVLAERMSTYFRIEASIDNEAFYMVIGRK